MSRIVIRSRWSHTLNPVHFAPLCLVSPIIALVPAVHGSLSRASLFDLLPLLSKTAILENAFDNRRLKDRQNRSLSIVPDSDSNDITRSHVQLAHGSIIGHLRTIEKIGAFDGERN